MRVVPHILTLGKTTFVVTTIVLVFLVLLGLTWAANVFLQTNPIAAQTELTVDIQPYIQAEFRSTDLPSRQWMMLAMKIAKAENFAPASAARFYAYVAGAYADGLEATGSSEQASLATAAVISNITNGKYPTLVSNTLDNLKVSGQTPRAAAQKVIGDYQARSRSDGYNLVWDARTLPGGDTWYVRDNIVDKGAMAGQWKTWLLGQEDQFNVPPPPQRGSLTDQLELAEVQFAVDNRSSQDTDSIFFWQGSRGFQKGVNHDNITPAGVWQNILFVDGSAGLGDAAYAKVQKYLAEGIADAFIRNWAVKYQYLTQRPSMRIPGLATLFADPPFPSYVSGHSTISRTAAVILSALLPKNKSGWFANARDARNSRLQARIHFDIDNEIGAELGQAVGDRIVKNSHLAPAVDNPDGLPSLSSKNIQPDFKTLLLLQMHRLAEATVGRASVFVQNVLFRPSFKNVLSEAGVEKNGGSTGAAWSDFDGDGQLDLFIFGGVDGNRLYKQNKGRFTDVTEKAGIKLSRASFAGVFGDYDNDGCPDLYISNHASQPTVGDNDTLYHNNCDGTFTDVTDKAGIRDSYHGRGAAWADYNGDGLLDIYVANYGLQQGNDYNSEPNILYRNNGNGTFTNVTEAAGVTGVANCNPGPLPQSITSLHLVGGPYKESYQPIWFDYNNDGRPDLFISTDSGVSPLYRNNGNGTFTDVTKESGLCTLATGMGVTAGDYNNDGWLDLYVTNTGDNFLWKNNGDGTFTESARRLAVNDGLSIGWGAGFLDYDNDGWLDLYTVNGTVSGTLPWNPEIGKKRIDKLYHSSGGKAFRDVASREGIYGNDDKEAAAFADYNGDGFTDVLVIGSWINPLSQHRLYQNQGNGNHWLTVKLRGTTSNRDGIGARITVKSGGLSQIREVVSGSSFISQNSLWQTFGLGRSSKIDSLEVRWPSGQTQRLTNVSANQTLQLTEP